MEEIVEKDRGEGEVEGEVEGEIEGEGEVEEEERGVKVVTGKKGVGEEGRIEGKVMVEETGSFGAGPS